MDIQCLNCWNAIRAVMAGRHYIARIQGQPSNIGIFVDETYDIGRIEDVHWNPWFSTDKDYFSYQLLHGRAFVFARTDWEYVFNTFGFGYAIGYHFIKSKEGSCNGNFLGIGMDMAVNASVLVEESDIWGILISNGEFTSFLDPSWIVNFNKTWPSVQIVVANSNTGSLKISNSAFWGPSDGYAYIEGSGSVSFTSCVFNQNGAEMDHQQLYCIIAEGNGLFQVNANDFSKFQYYPQTQYCVKIGENITAATLTGNIFAGNKYQGILDYSQNSEIGLNAFLVVPQNNQRYLKKKKM